MQRAGVAHIARDRAHMHSGHGGRSVAAGLGHAIICIWPHLNAPSPNLGRQRAGAGRMREDLGSRGSAEGSLFRLLPPLDCASLWRREEGVKGNGQYGARWPHGGGQLPVSRRGWSRCGEGGGETNWESARWWWWWWWRCMHTEQLFRCISPHCRDGINRLFILLAES
jgi:hypothetical protein